jgi:glycolate oxidase FAD binding subunit
MDNMKRVEILSEIVGSPNVHHSSPHTSPYSVDGMVPTLVLFPGNIEETCQILTRANQEKGSITPWGSGTKIGWGKIPTRVDWIVCTKRLNRITDCDDANLTVTTEAGVPLSTVQELLKGRGRGYFIPLDPSFSQTATVGGIVATNSSGPKRHLYGTPRDLILGLGIILPDGIQNVWGGRTVKNVAGYDMTKLYIGSFGTLGLISEVTFRILPLPERRTTFVATFNASLTAFEGVSKIIQSELLPSAVEVLNSKVIETLDLQLSGKEAPILLAVDFEGFEESVRRQIGQVKEMIGPFHPNALHLLEGARQEKFWTGIRDFESVVRLSFPDSISCKIQVPISKTAEVFHLLEETADRMGLDRGFRCHAGSGIIDMDFLLEDLNPLVEDFIRTLDGLREKMRAFEGSIVIKRAPLPLKSRIDVWGPLGKDLILMQRLKASFDPDRLLNPGRFVGGI